MTNQPAPFALLAMPEESFPLTIELLALTDPNGEDPLWSRTFKRFDIIPAPPFAIHWPCWIRIIYGNGKVTEYREAS